MQAAKQLYSTGVQALAALPQLEAYAVQAKNADAASMRRWLASLLAIHQPKRMIALDCPWWNVAATGKVERFLAARPDARVFEYGAGASTAWLARRAGEVISVEHHAGWHGALGPMIADHRNVTLWHRELEGDGYIGAIAEAGGAFDLIVVDGRRRVECLAQAIPFLKPDGIVLFDDSARRRYRAAIAGCGLKEDWNYGRSYCVPYPDASSILHA